MSRRMVTLPADDLERLIDLAARPSELITHEDGRQYDDIPPLEGTDLWFVQDLARRHTLQPTEIA